MTYKKQTLIALVMCVAPLTLMIGCAKADGTAPQTAKHTSHEVTSKKTGPKKAGYDGRSAYLKPGAAIRLSHDYDGSSLEGNVETVEITLSDGYDAGTLTLDVVEDSELIYTGAQQHVFDMSGNKDHTLTLQIGTPQSGTHYMNLFANVKNEDGSNMQRSFSVAFHVGGSSQNPKYKTAPKTLASKGEAGFIVMQAQETIKVK